MVETNLSRRSEMQAELFAQTCKNFGLATLRHPVPAHRLTPTRLSVPAVAAGVGRHGGTPMVLRDFVNIMQYATGDADQKHLKVAPGSMLHAARHVNDNAFRQSDRDLIELHPALATDDIVNLVGALVVMQSGVGNFEMVYFGRCPVLFFEKWPNLPAGLGPGRHIGAVAPDEIWSWIHTL